MAGVILAYDLRRQPTGLGGAGAALASAFRDRRAAARVRRPRSRARRDAGASVGRRCPTASRRSSQHPRPPTRSRARTTGSRSPATTSLRGTTPHYPKALLEIGDPPPVLYFVGRRRDSRAAGARDRRQPQRDAAGHATMRARSRARCPTPASTIVSGLALGIDAAAHEGALEGPGSTLAVVGTGPRPRLSGAPSRACARDRRPRRPRHSEFPPGTPPREKNFPRRNRLISGLAQGVLVVEAALHSGSLITARYAGEQGREVFAIPGSIHSPLAKGLPQAHPRRREARRNGAGHPRRAGHGDASRSRDPRRARRDPASAVLDALGDDPADVDTLVARPAFPPTRSRRADRARARRARRVAARRPLAATAWLAR